MHTHVYTKYKTHFLIPQYYYATTETNVFRFEWFNGVIENNRPQWLNVTAN